MWTSGRTRRDQAGMKQHGSMQARPGVGAAGVKRTTDRLAISYVA